MSAPVVSLATLLAQPVTIAVAGQHLQVRPMTWIQIAEAMEILDPVMHSVAELVGLQVAREQQLPAIVALLANHREAASRFLALATGIEREQLEQLPPAPAAELLMGVLEVNADFFVASLPRLVERATTVAQRITQRVQASPTADSPSPSSA